MKFGLCFLFLFCVNSVSGDDIEGENEEELHRKRVIEHLTKTRTVIIDDYHLVTRQTATNIFMFRSYRTVSVIFYPVMRDTTDARFFFQAEEVHWNNIGTCEPQEVIINLKHGSFPAVNPDGYDFPGHFIDPKSRDDIYTIELLSNGQSTPFIVQNPKPGNWYALVYIKWQDPREQRVEQQGLAPVCDTVLYTDLQVKRKDDIELIDCHGPVVLDYADFPGDYKCITPDSLLPINLDLTVTNAPEDSYIFIKIQALSLPTEDNFLLFCFYDPEEYNSINITFVPNPNSWHYISLGSLGANQTKVANCESYFSVTDDDIEQVNDYPLELMRDDRGRFFTFDFGLPTTDIQDATSIINVTSGEVVTARFKVNNFHDIGGTLAIDISLLMSLKYYMGYTRELRKSSLLAFSEDNPYKRLVVCMDINHFSTPLANGKCRYNDRVEKALFVLNTTDSNSIYDKIFIPYPESGVWYLSFRLFCDNIVCPCKTADDGRYYVSTNGADEDVLVTNGTRLGEKKCNVSVVLSISSGSCIAGRCLNRGSCMLNTLGGLVMSFCSCPPGYGGWDCSDDSRMDSRAYMLMSVLLLTLSNLLFLFSIYVAIIRLYYTEAMMFTFIMLFSTFYHACDAPIQVAFCIFRRNILQFGDFFCGLMSFWVTLLAMSIINHTKQTFLQLLGAIMIALLTTWNMHSLLAFILPVSFGIVIVFISWYINYRKTKKMKYPRTYYRIHFPIGLFLVSIGLICYAFLQTEQNYKFVHSVWHMIIALSVVFLLPDKNRGPNVNPFLVAPDQSFKIPISRLFKKGS